MSLHDAYARTTPFEIAFPDHARVHALSDAVLEEAPRRGVDPSELDGFLALASVGELLDELHADQGQGDVSRVALLEYGTLAFHAVHFVRAGLPLFLLTTPLARRLVDEVPRGAPEPPASAGYLQLPQHLFWTRPEGVAPESLDGAFWSLSEGGRLYVLPITGVRPDRPGFGTLSVPDAPLAHARAWLRATGRASGTDYQSDLPGAQLDRLYAIESAGEILKLMARFFAHVAAHPGTAARAPDELPANAPRPSALPFTRVGD